MDDEELRKSLRDIAHRLKCGRELTELQAVEEALQLIKQDREAAMKKLAHEVDDIAETLSIPSITTWKQGEFIDSPKYKHMGDRWKYEQQEREETLIRPGGGTDNALFQVANSVSATEVAEYLEAIGKLLRQFAALNQEKQKGGEDE